MPLLAESESIIIGAVAGAIVVLLGAIGSLYLKVYGAKTTAARTNRKDTISEQYELIQAMKVDRQEDRELIHSLRDSQVAINYRLAICEYEREQMLMRLEDQGTALEKANIHVIYRPPSAGHLNRPSPPGTMSADTSEQRLD